MPLPNFVFQYRRTHNDIETIYVSQMSVVSSGVNTVLVCFAEAPGELRQNHPRLSNQMVRAWRLVYPEEFSYSILVNDDDDGVYTAPPSQMQSVPLVPSTSTTGAENQSDLD